MPGYYLSTNAYFSGQVMSISLVFGADFSRSSSNPVTGLNSEKT